MRSSRLNAGRELRRDLLANPLIDRRFIRGQLAISKHAL
jgi:hypothetical protein